MLSCLALLRGYYYFVKESFKECVEYDNNTAKETDPGLWLSDSITALSVHTSYTQNTAERELLKETSLKTFYQRNRFPTEQDLPFRKLIKKFKSCRQ